MKMKKTWSRTRSVGSVSRCHPSYFNFLAHSIGCPLNCNFRSYSIHGGSTCSSDHLTSCYLNDNSLFHNSFFVSRYFCGSNLFGNNSFINFHSLNYYPSYGFSDDSHQELRGDKGLYSSDVEAWLQLKQQLAKNLESSLNHDPLLLACFFVNSFSLLLGLKHLHIKRRDAGFKLLMSQLQASTDTLNLLKLFLLE